MRKEEEGGGGAGAKMEENEEEDGGRRMKKKLVELSWPLSSWSQPFGDQRSPRAIPPMQPSQPSPQFGLSTRSRWFESS